MSSFCPLFYLNSPLSFILKMKMKIKIKKISFLKIKWAIITILLMMKFSCAGKPCGSSKGRGWSSKPWQTAKANSFPRWPACSKPNPIHGTSHHSVDPSRLPPRLPPHRRRHPPTNAISLLCHVATWFQNSHQRHPTPTNQKVNRSNCSPFRLLSQNPAWPHRALRRFMPSDPYRDVLYIGSLRNHLPHQDRSPLSWSSHRCFHNQKAIRKRWPCYMPWRNKDVGNRFW